MHIEPIIPLLLMLFMKLADGDDYFVKSTSWESLINNSFTSLSVAIQAASTDINSIVYLLVDGPHSLWGESSKIRVSTMCDSITGDIIVTSLPCTHTAVSAHSELQKYCTDTSQASIFYHDLLAKCKLSGNVSLSFKNIKINGSKSFSSSCIQEYCTHCLSDEFLIGGRTVIENILPSSAEKTAANCSNHSTISLFNIFGSASLAFENCEISNLRQRFKSFVEIGDGGSLSISFCTISRMDMNQEGGFIFQSSDFQLFPVNISILSTVVQEFNRDHPYSTTYIGDSGFLNLKYVTNLTMIYVRFVNNLLFTSAVSTEMGFNRIGSIDQQVHIEDVSFVRTMGGTDGLISINDRRTFQNCSVGARVKISKLSFQESAVSNLGSFLVIKSSAVLFLEIDDISFEDSSSESMESMFNLEMSDSFFSECNNTTLPFVSVSNIEIKNNLVGTEQDQSNTGYIMITNLINTIFNNINILNNVVLTKSTDTKLMKIWFWILSSKLHPDINPLDKFLITSGLPIAFSSGQVKNIKISDAKFENIQQLSKVVMFGTGSPNLMHQDIEMNNIYINNTGYGIYLRYSADIGIFKLNNYTAIRSSLAFYNERNEPATGIVEVTNSSIENSGVTTSFTGGFYLTSGDYYIRNCIFKENRGIQGAAVYLNDFYKNYNSTILIEDSSFISNIGIYQAGDLMIQKKNFDDPSTIKIIIRRCIFKNAVGTLSASSMIIRADLTDSSVISDSYFKAGGIARGSVLFFSIYKGVLTLDNNTIENAGDKSERSSIIYNTSSGGRIKIQNTLFKDCTAVGIIRNERRVKVPYLEIKNCRFEGNQGTMIYNLQANFTDVGSVYFNNSNHHYTLYYGSKQSDAFFQDIDASYNYASEECAGFFIEGPDSTLKIYNSSITHNHATERTGVLTVKSSPKSIVFHNTTITDNYAPVASTFNVISSVEEGLMINQCKIMRNQGDALMYLSNTICIFSNTIVEKNIQLTDHAGIIATHSRLDIINSKFRSQTGKNGCFISSLNYNIVKVSNSSFEDSDCELGVIDMMSSELNLINSTFYNIKGIEGVVITSENKSKVNVTNCKFTSIAIKQGKLPGIMKLSSTQFVSRNSMFSEYLGSAIYASQNSAVSIIESRFTGSRNAKYGGALYCDRCSKVTISKSYFHNLEAENGGALYMRAQNDLEPYLLSYNIFSECRAGEGGAIYADEVSLNITYSSFNINSASLEYTGKEDYKGKGGGLYLSCDSEKYDCITHMQHNSFQNNSAKTNGGAFYFDTFEPYILNCSFIDNTAVYGNDNASFPLYLDFIEGEEAVKDMLSKVRSGSLLDIELKIGIYDAFGQLILTDNNNEAIIKTEMNNTKVSGSIISHAVNGVFVFSNFSITSKPGSSTCIVADSQVIQHSKYTGIHSVKVFSSTFVEHDIELRTCNIGEIEISDECRTCPPKTYSFKEDSKICTACPSSAECFGGTEVYTKKGYWRSFYHSDEFFECFNPDACIGHNNYTSYTGECEIGYKGILCSVCQENYYKQKRDVCEKCLNPENLNYIKLAGIITLGIVILVVLVITYIKSANKGSDHFSVYFKIFFNYIQIVSLVGTFNLDWSNLEISLFNPHETIGDLFDQLYSLDCLLDDNKEEIFFQKLTIFSIAPVIFLLIISAVWLLISLFSKNFKKMQTEFIANVLIVFLIVYSNLMKHLLSNFNCTLINGQFWLHASMNIECWTGSHLKYTLALAVPSILLYGIICPTVILISLMHFRKDLHIQNNKLRFGFLILGYESKYFYWEFVILSRKMIIAIVSVFLSHSVSIQALTSLLVLILYGALQLYINPLKLTRLNELEYQSILVSGVTIYCGLYYLKANLNNTARKFFFFAIILVNTVFLFKWIYFIIINLLNKLRNIFFKRVSPSFSTEYRRSNVYSSPELSYRSSASSFIDAPGNSISDPIDYSISITKEKNKIR